MNVLLLSQLYSSKNLHGISMVNCLLDVIDLVNDVRDDVTWWFAVPESKDFLTWDESIFAAHKRVNLLPILGKHGANQTEFFDGFAGLGYPFFGPKSYPYFASDAYMAMDVVLSNFYTAQMIPGFQAEHANNGYFTLPKISPPAIGNLLTEMWLDRSLPELCSDMGKRITYMSVLSSAATLLLTEADRKALRKDALRYCSASDVRGLDLRVMTPAMDPTQVPNYERPAERTVFFHGGTFEAKRHLEWLGEQVGKVSAMSPAARLLNTSQSPKVPGWGQAMSKDVVEFRQCAGREKYREALADGDFCLAYIDYEGTGLGYTEAILSGMTPIWMRKPWNEGRLPDDYPFFCRSESDFTAAMAYCAMNPVKAKQVGQQAIDFVRQRHDRRVQGLEWAQILTDLARVRLEASRARMGGHFMVGLMKSGIDDLPSAFCGEDMTASVARQSKNMTPQKLMEPAMWSRMRVLAQMNGLVEVDAGSEPGKSQWRRA